MMRAEHLTSYQIEEGDHEFSFGELYESLSPVLKIYSQRMYYYEQNHNESENICGGYSCKIYISDEESY